MRDPDNLSSVAAAARGAPGSAALGVALLSVGGIVAAIGSAACCVIPFALFTAGVTGAWIGNLTALEPFQPIFLGIALACLAGGYWRVFRRRPVAVCAEDDYCARPQAERIARLGFAVAAVIVAVAVGFPYIARLFLDT